MMMRAIRAIPWWNATFMFIGIVIALGLMPIISAGVSVIIDMYDKTHPVATATLHSAERIDHDTMRLRIWVTRKRDCEVARVVGFTGNSPALMSGASTMRREDGSAPVSYPVGVTVLSQPWILAPVYGPRLWIWGYYECDGRIVKTPLIDEVVQ